MECTKGASTILVVHTGSNRDEKFKGVEREERMYVG